MNNLLLKKDLSGKVIPFHRVYEWKDYTVVSTDFGLGKTIRAEDVDGTISIYKSINHQIRINVESRTIVGADDIQKMINSLKDAKELASILDEGIETL